MSEGIEPGSGAEGVPPAIRTVHRAQRIAEQRGHEYITLEHLLASLIEREDIREIFEKMKVDHALVSEEIKAYLDSDGYPVVPGIQSRPTETLEEVMYHAVSSALMSGRPKTTPVDLLVYLVSMPHEDSFAVSLLLKVGLTPLALKKHLSHGKSDQRRPGGMLEGGAPAGNSASITTRAEAEEYVETYAKNLNKAAANFKIDPLIGRTTEIDAIIQIMSRRTKNNVILVGEPGVGKTAIAEGLALKIVRNEVPQVIADTTVYSLEIASMLAGTRYRGDFEERMKDFLKAIDLIPGAILFIDEMHTIMGAGAGSTGSLDVANILKPALSKGTMRCMGSTTHEEYRKHFEKDRAFARRFKRVEVQEPTPEDAKLILRGLAPYYAEFHGVTYTPEALDAAVDLTSRYLNGAYLPDKAIDIIDNAGARQRVAAEDVRVTTIDITLIEEEVAKVAKIPAQAVAQDEKDRLRSLEGDLKASVVGQEMAAQALSDAVFVQRAGLAEANKPAGCFLFAGPTGVGKTEMARTLAKTLGVRLLKYDMSEYMEKHSVSRLIGSPPGYVGYGEGNSGSGELINDMETYPYCVLLLDEVEKAHPDIFNIFLQAMDDGKVTSASGKEVSFRNVIIIMTTNAGATELQKNRIGFGAQENADGDDKVINRMFSPEFRNRLDAIIKFKSLKPEHMLFIVDKFIRELNDRAGHRGVIIELNDDAREWLAKKGYDATYGARPLKRVVSENISKPLSRLIVLGPLTEGGTARVSVENEKLAVAA